jgi:hypothetical protein
VSIRFERVEGMADYFSLFALATEKSRVVLHGIDARFTASRGAAGLTLDVVTRDAILVVAALEATRGATVRVSRPRGAKLYGPDATTRRLASFSKAIRDWPITFDASWKDMLSR